MENENAQEKAKADLKKWFEELDRLTSEPFLIDRERPVTPERRIFD